MSATDNFYKKLKIEFKKRLKICVFQDKIEHLKIFCKQSFVGV